MGQHRCTTTSSTLQRPPLHADSSLPAQTLLGLCCILASSHAGSCALLEQSNCRITTSSHAGSCALLEQSSCRITASSHAGSCALLEQSNCRGTAWRGRCCSAEPHVGAAAVCWSSNRELAAHMQPALHASDCYACNPNTQS